jgi:Ran GTPase-activating protein 1
LADALLACHKNSLAAGGKRFALKQFIAGRNRLENEGAQALAKAFEVTITTMRDISCCSIDLHMTIDYWYIGSDSYATERYSTSWHRSMTKAFVHNRNLRIIDLNDNTITTAAQKLASTIDKLPKLQMLNRYRTCTRFT